MCGIRPPKLLFCSAPRSSPAQQDQNADPPPVSQDEIRKVDFVLDRGPPFPYPVIMIIPGRKDILSALTQNYFYYYYRFPAPEEPSAD
jgi:hypothetical protein